jgi:hypothetical protein
LAARLATPENLNPARHHLADSPFFDFHVYDCHIATAVCDTFFGGG